MGRRLEKRISFSSAKIKNRTKPAPSSRDLAKQYFDLACLRQRVRIAESGQVVGRELTKSLALAAFA